jgi:hypothetical protein
MTPDQQRLHPDCIGDPSLQSECKTRRSTPCGGRFALHDVRADELVRARRLCRRLHCPDCGPRRRAGYIDKYLPLLAGGPAVVMTVAKHAWPKLRRKLVEAGVQGIPLPGPGDTKTIVATGGDGQVWDDPREALEAAVAAIPEQAIDGGQLRLRPRPFGIEAPAKPATRTGGAGGGGEQGKRYAVLGTIHNPDFAIDAYAERLGIGHEPAVLTREWTDGRRYHVSPGSELGQRFLRRWGLRRLCPGSQQPPRVRPGVER